MDGHNHTGVKDGAQLDQYASVKQVQNSDGQFLTNVTGTNDITGDTAPMATAYVAGQMFSFVAVNANTGAMTLNVASIGAKNITKNGADPLIAGDISAGAVVTALYDGAQFQLVSPIRVPETIAENSYLNFTGVATKLTAGASPNFTLTVDGAPKFSAFTLTAGQRFRVLFHATVGGPSSLNINGSGAKPIKAYSAGGLFNPAIPIGTYYDLQYDGTNYVALNPVQAEFASAAEALAATIQNKVLTPSGLSWPRAFTADGYQKLPGTPGLIIQWGKSGDLGDWPGGVRTLDLTFPITFPSQVLCVLPVNAIAGNFAGGTVNWDIPGTSLSGLRLKYAEYTAATQTTNYIQYIAIGY